MSVTKTYIRKNSGQTLVEVVVALGVVVLLVTGLITGTIYALKANQNARARSISTKYVQEAIEIARKDRDNSWYDFRNLSGTYCFNQGTTTFIGSAIPHYACTGANVFEGSPQIALTRNVKFNWLTNPTEMMEVTVTVTWMEGSAMRTSQATTDFTQWR